MTVWLCPVKRRSWQLIRQYDVFGTPKKAHKAMEEVKIGDILIIYLLRPANAIVAIYDIVSELYEDHLDIWGQDRYPLRVNLRIRHDFAKEKHQPLPLSCIYGGNSRSNLSIEPFFKNVSLVKIGNNQYQNLVNCLSKPIKPRVKTGNEVK